MIRKNIRYTRHAIERKLERNITDEQIKQTLEYPDYTKIYEDRKIAVKRINGKTITVVFVEGKTYIKIITAY
jgi:hypothetical protein